MIQFGECGKGETQKEVERLSKKILINKSHITLNERRLI